MLFGVVEKGFEADAGVLGREAVIELGIAFFGGVIGVKSAYTMVVITTGGAQGIHKGEADFEPVVVGGGDVELAGFDLGGDVFDVVTY